MKMASVILAINLCLVRYTISWLLYVPLLIEMVRKTTSCLLMGGDLML